MLMEATRPPLFVIYYGLSRHIVLRSVTVLNVARKACRGVHGQVQSLRG